MAFRRGEHTTRYDIDAASPLRRLTLSRSNMREAILKGRRRHTKKIGIIY